MGRKTFGSQVSKRKISKLERLTSWFVEIDQLFSYLFFSRLVDSMSQISRLGVTNTTDSFVYIFQYQTLDGKHSENHKRK